jgi:hypothetical protein
MKGELSGVGPVFGGVADPIGSGFVASLARGAPAAASWRVLARRERAAAGRGAPIADCPKRARRSSRCGQRQGTSGTVVVGQLMPLPF